MECTPLNNSKRQGKKNPKKIPRRQQCCMTQIHTTSKLLLYCLSISWSPLDPCFYPNVHEYFVFQELLGWRMLVEVCHTSPLLLIFLTCPKYVPYTEGKGYLRLLFRIDAFQISVKGLEVLQ